MIMKTYIAFIITLYATTLLAQVNSYIYPGDWMENKFFTQYDLPQHLIADLKIKTITEEQIESSTIFHFNRNGQIERIEDFLNSKKKTKLQAYTIISYDSNNYISSYKLQTKHNKTEYKYNSEYDNEGRLLKFTEFFYNLKGKIKDSSHYYCDSIADNYYLINSLSEKTTYKVNLQNKIVVVKSPFSIDSIATTIKGDSTYKTYLYKNCKLMELLDYEKFMTGKIEIYYKNHIIDEKNFHKDYGQRTLNYHKTYQYDKLDRLTFITLDDYIKDQIIFLYHYQGLLYQKIQRISEMEFSVTKYNYTYY